MSKHSTHQPDVVQSGSIWKTVVSHKQQEIIEERYKNIPAQIIANGRRIVYPISNEVKIIDKKIL